jgi:hypothetical protein
VDVAAQTVYGVRGINNDSVSSEDVHNAANMTWLRIYRVN